MLFSILAETDYEFESADMQTVFLYGEVPDNQDSYMSRPAGLTYNRTEIMSELSKIYNLNTENESINFIIGTLRLDC